MNDTREPKLTHIDQSGNAQMVDVGWKPDTQREAVARGRVVMQPQTLELIQANAFDKGDVLAVARIAGIMGAKNTSQLIPLCHPLPINKIGVEFDLNSTDNAVEITAVARTTGKTGRRDGGAHGGQHRCAHHLRHVQVGRSRVCGSSRCGWHASPAVRAETWTWSLYEPPTFAQVNRVDLRGRRLGYAVGYPAAHRSDISELRLRD